jgi:diphthamide synthase (EF-2-diphthine--ammonia ligase)
MIAGGLRAKLACIDSKQLNEHLRRPRIRRSAAQRFAAKTDPCGERGEFHTCVYAGPMFTAPLQLEARRDRQPRRLRLRRF